MFEERMCCQYHSTNGEIFREYVVTDVMLPVTHASRIHVGREIDFWQRAESIQRGYLSIPADLSQGQKGVLDITRISPHGRETIFRLDSFGKWRDQSQVGRTHLLLGSPTYGVVVLEIPDNSGGGGEDNPGKHQAGSQETEWIARIETALENNIL